MVKFSDLFEFQGKSGIKAGAGLASGKYPFYTSSRDLSKYSDDFLFQGDSLIFGTGGEASVHFNNGKFAVSTDCLVAQPKTHLKVESRYYYYFLKGNIHILEKGFRGAGLKHISKGYISQIELPTEDYQRQKHVVKILDSVESLLLKRKQSLQLLDDFLRATFLDMFGDPVLNSKKWRKTLLQNAFSIEKEGTKCGPFGSALKKKEYVLNGVPVLNMDNITSNGFGQTGCLFITEKKYQELKSYSVSNGDIIISRAGTVGKMCAVTGVAGPSIISTNLIRLSLNNKLIKPEYFVSLFKYYGKHIGKLRAGADGAYSFMNTGILKRLEIPQPPINVQEKFSTIKKNIEKIRQKILLSLDELLNQLNALMQQYFS